MNVQAKNLPPMLLQTLLCQTAGHSQNLSQPSHDMHAETQRNFDEVEDEHHFLFDYPAYSHVRSKRFCASAHSASVSTYV